MPRLNVFAKGNLDLRDALVCARSGEAVLWNGLNAALRPGAPGWTARVRHETCTRSDALLAATGRIPDAVQGAGLDLGAFPLESQYSAAVFEAAADVVVLSIMPDVMTRMGRIRGDGALLLPYDSGRPSDAAWYRRNLELAPHLRVGEAMRNLSGIVERIRTRSDPAILVCNMSSVVPGEWVHDHRGMPETLATRIRRFNLGLVEVSAETGVSIVDVDALVARAGAERIKLDTMHLSAEGARLVAEETVRILQHLGRIPG